MGHLGLFSLLLLFAALVLRIVLSKRRMFRPSLILQVEVDLTQLASRPLNTVQHNLSELN